jgi:hypothetical protein
MLRARQQLACDVDSFRLTRAKQKKVTFLLEHFDMPVEALFRFGNSHFLQNAKKHFCG